MKKLNQKKSSNQKGFTLIELIVVIAIIAILAAVAVPNFISLQARAEQAQEKANAAQIIQAINVYNALAESEGKTKIDSIASISTVKATASEFWPKGLTAQQEAAAFAWIDWDDSNDIASMKEARGTAPTPVPSP